MICELISSPGGEAAVVELIDEAVRRNRPDYVIAVAPSQSWEGGVLRRARFLQVPRVGPRFTVRSSGEEGVDLDHWSTWHLSLGDLELF